MTRPKI